MRSKIICSNRHGKNLHYEDDYIKQAALIHDLFRNKDLYNIADKVSAVLFKMIKNKTPFKGVPKRRN